MVRKDYDPHQYWGKRGKNYMSVSEREDELDNLLDCLSKHLPEEERVLEIGSGTGRVYNYLIDRLPEIKGRFDMCDIVDSFRTVCVFETGVVPAKWDGKILPYEKDSAFFVVSFSVLLHVPPEDLEACFSEHMRVCSKYMFLATWFVNGDDWKSGLSYFRHDYLSLFKKYNLKVSRIKCSHPRRGNWLLEKNSGI